MLFIYVCVICVELRCIMLMLCFIRMLVYSIVIVCNTISLLLVCIVLLLLLCMCRWCCCYAVILYACLASVVVFVLRVDALLSV